MVKHWDELKEILRDLDPDGYGTVDIQEFKVSHTVSLVYQTREGMMVEGEGENRDA